MSSKYAKGLVAGGLHGGAMGGLLGSLWGIASALGLQLLAVISVGLLLLGNIGSWWLKFMAPAYYAPATTQTAMLGDDLAMLQSKNPVLVALAIVRHLKKDEKGSWNEYDLNDSIMQPVIKYWKQQCHGSICPNALPKSQGGNGLQCAMFIHTVYDIAHHPLPAGGNAIDYWSAEDQQAFKQAGWKYINNGEGMPSIGDLVVMDHGPYGHILMVVGVEPPKNGKDGALYMAQANASSNTEIGGAPLLKWPLRSSGYLAQDWGPDYRVMGYIHNEQLSKQWGNPLFTAGGGNIDCSKVKHVSHELPRSEYVEMARKAAQQMGINADIYLRQIKQESGFNPDAVSPVGAIGIAQFMPATAAGMGIDPHDPGQALCGGAKLMANQLKEYGGNYAKALAAYNAGGGGVASAVRRCGENFRPCLPTETRNYLAVILAGMDDYGRRV